MGNFLDLDIEVILVEGKTKDIYEALLKSTSPHTIVIAGGAGSCKVYYTSSVALKEATVRDIGDLLLQTFGKDCVESIGSECTQVLHTFYVGVAALAAKFSIDKILSSRKK
jgi:hypothetical protein